MRSVLKEILLDIERLEPFPVVASRVLELGFQDEVDSEALIAVVRTDAGVTSKVLRLANSARFGGRVPITSIDHAGRRLGPMEIVNLVLSSVACSYYMGLGSSTLRSNRTLWEESVTNAVAARMLAARIGYEDPELAYTVGLLQNVGHVVMDRFLARERDDVLGRVDAGLSLLEAEKEILGLDHARIGARIARKWGFPPILVDGILYHHEPLGARVDRRLCEITGLAEELSWAVLGGGLAALSYGVSGHTFEKLEDDRPEISVWRELLSEELAKSRELLGLGTQQAA